MNLREALKKKLTQNEMLKLRAAFDVIGTIAVIEISRELIRKQKVIAETLLSLHKNIRTVAKKEDIHKGRFRTQKVKILLGEKTKETACKENNVRLKLNIEKAYFSPRLSTERKRIMHLVKPGESVLVMFSGIAPYVCVIAKNTKATEVYGIEANPAAHKYALENVMLNKIKNAKLFLGDVRKIVPKLNKKFDRILMPLPKQASDFLNTALDAAKKGTVVHFYDFEHETEFKLGEQKIVSACRKAKKKCKIIGTFKCGQHAPRIYRICIDFKVLYNSTTQGKFPLDTGH